MFDDEQDKPRFVFGVVSENKQTPLRDYYGLERYDQWVFAYIPELRSVAVPEDKRLEMLSREYMFPTDPLAVPQFGGQARAMPIGAPQQQPGARPTK